MKKLFMCLISAAAFALTGTVTFTGTAAFAETVTFTETAGFADESAAVNAKTPYDKNYVEIMWSTSEAETAGVPLADGEFVLIPTLNKVNKLAQKDGSLVSFAELDEKVSENCRGAVLNGVLVQPARTKIFVVETEDMRVVCSAAFGEIVTDVAVIDNYAYFGAKTGDAYKFVCADVSDGLKTVWEYASDSAVTSPSLFGEYVLFGAGESLVAHGKNGAEFAENPVGAEITAVFAGKYAVFMSGADGNLYKLRLTDGGSAEEDTLISCGLGGELTAPAELNNRVYVGSSEGFFVLDGLNMEVAERFPELKNCTAPFICTGRGQRAYTAAPYTESDGGVCWYLYNILDGDDVQTVSELAKIIDYTDGRSAVAANGTMFFRDAFGRVWAVRERENDLFTIILKILLMLAIIIMLMLILRAWAKKRNEKKPPQY
ncbi:MAG: hypothetical protein NC299_04365 [Lachnospiraceae bacterium]|nr:hypothetical protein [Lachnospiraceae bacterium]